MHSKENWIASIIVVTFTLELGGTRGQFTDRKSLWMHRRILEFCSASSINDKREGPYRRDEEVSGFFLIKRFGLVSSNVDIRNDSL